MQTTTNYSLLLPEGTDIVNPLTQVNPNFSTIDGAMFANKQSSIGTATEVVTGTVHAIVRSNTDSNVFRFTATGEWTAGDSMTVDGVGVTVHLSDGTAPATGSYIIGAEVLAMINGTLVTLAISSTPPAQGVTSFNSRTGAVVPTDSDYDGSMIDYDNTGSGLTATDTQAAIDELQTEIQNIPTGGTVDYSLTEHEIGTWVDGTTLYEKTVNCGAMPNNTTKNVAHSIINLDTVVQMYGMMKSANQQTPLPNVDSSAMTNQISLSINATDIILRSSGNWSTFSGYVTVRYTKSA